MAGNNANNIRRWSISPAAVLTGALLSFGLALFTGTVAGMIVSWSSLSGDWSFFPWFSYLFVALGGVSAARKGKRLGWFHGIFVGFVYFVIAALFFQGNLTGAQLLSQSALMKLFGWMVAGAIGGMFGVGS